MRERLAYVGMHVVLGSGHGRNELAERRVLAEGHREGERSNCLWQLLHGLSCVTEEGYIIGCLLNTVDTILLGCVLSTNKLLFIVKRGSHILFRFLGF